MGNPNVGTVVLTVIAAIAYVAMSAVINGFGWRERMKKDIELCERLEGIADSEYDRIALDIFKAKIFVDLEMQIGFKSEMREKVLLSILFDPVLIAMIVWLMFHCYLWISGNANTIASLAGLIVCVAFGAAAKVKEGAKKRKRSAEGKDHPSEKRIEDDRESEVDAREHDEESSCFSHNPPIASADGSILPHDHDHPAIGMAVEERRNGVGDSEKESEKKVWR